MAKSLATPKKTTAKTGSKTLIIAEKPSVAQDIVKALPGKFQNHKTYFECDKYVVSFAIGHLVTICTPPEINEIHKSWSLDNLPICPEEFPLKSIRQTKSQLVVLNKLVKRRDISDIINACDAGREGELVFRYIIKYIAKKRQLKKNFHRLWLQSMTKEAILEGFDNLRNNEEMLPLADAAICRSEADWLIGINGSRALTGYKSRNGGFHLTPCGRVQTPTISIIINREEEIGRFQSRLFWEITGTFQSGGTNYTGRWVDSEFKKSEENTKSDKYRFWEKAKAEAVIKKCTGRRAEVTETSKPSLQNCPMLYDLTSMQREANNRFGYSAKHTLDVLQALYDRHKVVTYPRTGSRHLPENYIKTVKSVMKAMKNTPFGEFAAKPLKENWVKPNKKIFNNAKITDHYAIIPTNNTPDKLAEDETKIYQMVARRFLAIFYPPAQYLNTTRLSIVENETFFTEGKVLKDAGWKVVYGLDKKEDAVLDPLEENPSVKLQKAELVEDATRPPPRFTESTLLSVMESAGKLVEDEDLQEVMKERGLGTPATRAAIIEGLIKDKYILRQNKELVPSAKAAELVETISTMKIEELKSPEMTGQWEYRLEQIARGEQARKDFMKDIRLLTHSIVNKVKSFDESDVRNMKALFVHDATGQTIYETLSYYESRDDSIRIRKFMGGRFITKEEINQLLREKKLGPLTGFISKAGKPFTAVLKLNEQNKVRFVFEDVMESPPDFSKMSVIGTSPLDGSNVYEGEMSFVSETAYKKGCKTGLKINKVILGQPIKSDDIVLMLEGKRTKLIKGFQSTKTKKKFDAYLALPKSGKISFSFPTRTGKKFRKKAEKVEKS